MRALKEVWENFSRELAARSMETGKTMAGVWGDVAEPLRGVADAFSSIQAGDPPAASVRSLAALLEEAATPLLFQPVEGLRQRRPILRAISVLQDYDSLAGDLVRRLPATAQLNGHDLISMVASDAAPSWYVRLRAWRRTQHTLPLRNAVEDHLENLILGRAALDGGFQLLLAQACLHLLGPWQTSRRLALRALANARVPEVDVAAERQRWVETAQAYHKRAAQFQGRYEAWASAVNSRLAGALLGKPSASSRHSGRRRSEKHQKHLSYWARQQRAVASVLDLELQMARFGQAATGEIAAGLRVLDDQHEELVRELDSCIGWLESWTDAGSTDSFPPPGTRLVASEERLAEWQRRLAGIARERLPVVIETAEPRRALPGFRRPWRELEPAKAVLQALETAGAPILLGGFREVEAAHRAVVREIERAREVVSYGFEAASAEASSEGLAREAVDNALSLLTYHKRALPEIHPVAETSAVQAASTVLLECHVAFERGRIGLLTHISRQRGRDAALQGRDLAATAFRLASQRGWKLARRWYRWGLLRIGLISPPRPLLEPVVRRTHLGDVLAVQLHARDLPMIYRRLFRLAPVEDPRFLVGREAELAGLREAVSRWEGGRSASVLIVGARGSGKTSLINCARMSIFDRYEVVAGQFCQRIASPAEMDEFLRRLLQFPEDADLESALTARPRVIMIEEFERTFLRTMNGFEPLRRLLDLVHSTGGQTLWIFSTNETAYQYLDVVTGLGRHFSHRLNAMSVRQEDLTSAILQRHNLSGLRLEFAPLPQEDPRVSRARRFFGLELDPRQSFLDALYQQSEGIFRSAFELWQGSIERVEGGTVHMRQPLAPDYRPLLAALTLDDCFALKAILQHGSLTGDELAQVFATGGEASRRQLERLAVLDLLEPEPASPGLRVRPEAGRAVREALARANLL